MTEWMYTVDYLLAGALLVMMAIGIAFSAYMPALNKWNKRYFLTLFSLLFLCAVTCLLSLFFYDDPTKAATERVIYFFESLFMSVPIFMPTIFLLHCSHEKIKRSVLFYAMTALLCVYFAILIAAQFTDVFYYVTDDNRFFYGPLYKLSLVPLVLIMLLNIVGVIIRRKKLSNKHLVALLVYLIPMSAAIIVQMFINVELFVVFGMALFAIIMFVLILSDNMEQYMRQQQEIAHQRASVMVLQMRPHFIYSENPVPFSDELKHTQAYLAVEQAQHEDNLFTEFDTPHTLFRVPPLTLQPLVENAVKHGMKLEGDPLHIYVKTRKTNSGSEIVVENDGPGFNPADDNEPHIALNNIRQRLEMMCKGTLTISPRDGGGTVVTVFIPISKIS